MSMKFLDVFLAVVFIGCNALYAKPIAMSHCGAGNFEMVWNDDGSGAQKDGSYWKPINIPQGFYYLSHVGITGKSAAQFDKCVWLLKPEHEWQIRTPDALTWIYDDYKTGAKRDLTLVRPQVYSTPGYRCLGDLAVPGRFVPENPAQFFPGFACVHESLVAPGVAGYETWNDKGSGGRHDVSTWTIVSMGPREAIPNGFFTQNGYNAPTSGLFVLNADVISRPELEIKDETKPVVIKHCGSYNFEEVWNDIGSGAKLDGSYWKPKQLPAGYYYLGHVGVTGLDFTSECVWLIQPHHDWQVRIPDRLVWIYDDYKTGANRDLTFVRPQVTSPGYKCLSDLAVAGRFVPENPGDYFAGFVCVHDSLVEAGRIDRMTWSDDGSGGRHDLTTWSITTTEGELFPHGIYAHPSHGRPEAAEVYVLKSDKVERKSLYKEELDLTTEQVMAKFGPNIYFHPDEKFLPDSAEFVFERSTYKKCIIENEGSYDRQLINCNPNDVAAYPDKLSEWIVIPEHLHGGSMERAKTYINRKESNRELGYTDFLVWIFNAYNGPGYFYAPCGAIEVEQRLEQSGTHQGDWEHVTLRIRHASETQEPRLEAIYFSAHQGGKWVPIDDVANDDDGRKMVFAALYTHAFYPTAPSRINYCKPFALNLLVCKLSVNLVDFTAKGYKLQSSTKFEVLQKTSSPVMTFMGRWGDYINIKETVEVGFIPVYTFKEATSGPSGPPRKSSQTVDEIDEPICS